jgi:hypothetical protein
MKELEPKLYKYNKMNNIEKGRMIIDAKKHKHREVHISGRG